METIYGRVNGELPIESIIGRIIETIAEATSPFELVDVHSTFVKALGWYFAFCNRVSIDVQTCVIARYPKLCPACLTESCICERTNRWPTRATHLAGSRDQTLKFAAETIVNAAKISNAEQSHALFDLNWFSSTLSDIYPVNKVRWRVNRFYFPSKMLRETGKLANGFRRYKNAADSFGGTNAKVFLEKDAADFFAWLIGYWTLLASELNDLDLQKKYTTRYAIGCPYCHQIPCSCPPAKRLGNRAEFIAFNLSSGSSDLAKELQQRLAQLSVSLEPFPEIKKEFDEELAQNNKSPSKDQAINTLQSVAEKLKKADDMSGNAESIIRRVTAIGELILRFVT